MIPGLLLPGRSRQRFIPYGSGITLNGADKSADLTLTGGNLIVQNTATDSDWDAVRATSSVASGCKYWEAKITQLDNVGIDAQMSAGIADSGFVLSAFVGGSANSGGVYSSSAAFENGSFTAVGGNLGAFALNDVLMFGLDMVRGELYAGRNGTWANGGHPSLRTGPIITGIAIAVYPVVAVRGSGGGTTGGDRFTMNFGGSAFAYPIPA